MAHLRFQDALALILAVLVAWAILQLGTPYGLPYWLTGGLGTAAGAGLAAWHLRGGRRGTPGAWEGPDGVEIPRVAAGWILAAIVVAAAVLRLHTLLDRPAWDDEMWTLRNIYTSSWPELFRVAFDDYWPPLHYVILNTLARIGDTGLAWLRGPSVVFGVAAVAVTYPLGVRLFRRRFPALVAAALLAGMTAHVLYSQEARVYSLQLFLAILSAHYFFKSYWERRVSPAFLVSTTLLTYSHSFASWYFIAAQAVYVFVAWLVWRDGEAFRKGFVSQLLVLVLWLPLVGAFVYSRFAREIVVPTFWATAPEGLPGPMDLLELYQSLAVRSWAGAAFMSLLILLGLGILRRSAGFAPRPRPAPGAAAPSDGPPTGAAVVFLLAWVSVPVLFSLAVTVGTSLDTFPETRYHLTVLPGLCLLAAAGAARVTSRAGAVAVAALVLLLPASQLPRYYRDFTRVAYDQAASVIATHRAPGELIFVGGGFRTLAYYYRGSFPRIGSPEWDRLATETASFRDRLTIASGKWGDSYAFEKMPPEIHYIGRLGGPPEVAVVGFVREAAPAGLFDGSYWLVLRVDRDEVILPAMADHGVACDSAKVYTVPGLEIRHCNPGAGTQTASP